MSSAPVTRSISVVAYDFVGAGFLPPILNPPGINRGKPGSQYPIKWQLKDANGRFISDLTTVTGVFYLRDGTATPCDFVHASGPAIPLSTGGTVLRYDSKNNQFVYNWTTPSTPPGGCYIFQLFLSDGSMHEAWFQLF